MRYLFVGYILSLLGSLFIASWQVAVFAVAMESLLAGLILIRTEGLETWSARIQVCDLIIVRALIVPLLLVGMLKKIKPVLEYSTVPANFVIWIFATLLFIASFWFGQVLYPSDFQSAGYLGTAVAGVLTGIFVLANQISFTGQIVGVLTLEASIALNEIVANHHPSLEIQIGLSLIFIWLFFTFRRFLGHFLEISRLEAIPTPLIENSKEPPQGMPKELPQELPKKLYEEKDVL